MYSTACSEKSSALTGTTSLSIVPAAGCVSMSHIRAAVVQELHCNVRQTHTMPAVCTQ
jgi:hypothetical protein